MNIVITGVNRGLGLGFVHYYLNQGCHVWACYRIDHRDLGNINSDHLHTVLWDISQDDGPKGKIVRYD